jgi:hypothetical protein
MLASTAPVGAASSSQRGRMVKGDDGDGDVVVFSRVLVDDSS